MYVPILAGSVNKCIFMSLQPMLYVEPVVARVAIFTHAVTCVFISDAVSEYKIQHLLTPPTSVRNQVPPAMVIFVRNTHKLYCILKRQYGASFNKT